MNIQIINEQITYLVISFFISLILGLIIVPKLRKYKIGQVVRTDGPKSHLKKSGTPIMGGIIIILTLVLILGFLSIKSKIMLLPLLSVVGFGFIGFIDDFKKLVLKTPEGLSPRKKMLGLILVVGIFLVLYLNVFNLSTDIIIPLFNQPLKLSVGAFILFTAFILLATTNAVNLTDGLDGLATGVSAIIMTFFTIMALKHNDMDMVRFGASTVGALLAFLIFNLNPAKVFLGDTGSLALGGAIASIAIILKMPLFLAVVALVCVIDTLSVMLQVTYFKLTKGKRIFKMAPYHHHLELSGMKETTVVWIFWSITIIMCIVAYFIA